MTRLLEHWGRWASADRQAVDLLNVCLTKLDGILVDSLLLCQHILVPAKCRYSLQQVMTHPWVLQGASVPKPQNNARLLVRQQQESATRCKTLTVGLCQRNVRHGQKRSASECFGCSIAPSRPVSF